MTQPEKGKNIFQKAMDSVSNRDEKAAIEAAMKRSEELEQRSIQAEQKAVLSAQKLATAEQQIAKLTAELSAARTELGAVKTDLTKAKSDLMTASNTVKVTEQRLAAANAELQKHAGAEQAQKMAAAAEVAAKSQIMAEHTLKADESLSHLSLKYYGSAYEPYWRVIYEANKELIGENPGRVRPGMVIKIPVLPEELKKK